MASAVPEWPDHSPAEMVADGAIHALGFLGASIALFRLGADMGPDATSGQSAALAAYAVGLLGMLLASALYNLSPPGRAKDVLCKLDQSMIFVMIAGSYTPFAVSVFPARIGVPLCVVVWGIAAVGIGLCVALPNLHERIALALYLGMGWLVLAVMPPLIAAASATVLALLVAGGIVYSLGVVIHTRMTASFRKAAWHGMVVAAAALHLAAVALVLP